MDTTQVETPSPTFIEIVTGDLLGDSTYATWRPRGTCDWLFIFTIDGVGEFRCDGGSFIAEPGDVVLIPPGVPHDYRTNPSREHWDICWAHFHPPANWSASYFAWPQPIVGGPRRVQLADHPETCELVYSSLREMRRFGSSAQERRERFAMNALERALLWCSSVHPSSSPRAPLRDKRVAAAADWLCQHLADCELSASDSAICAGVSPSRLSRLFRAQTGMTPQQFLERERIHRACQLLEATSLTISEIAASVGFADPFYFSNRFLRLTGMRPRTWRRSMQMERKSE